MKSTKKFWSFVGVFFFVFFAVAGTLYAQTEDILRVAFTADARTIDPGTATRDYTGYATISGLYDFLVQYARVPNEDGTIGVDTAKVEPMLAERWEHNEDMSEWVCLLYTSPSPRDS